MQNTKIVIEKAVEEQVPEQVLEHLQTVIFEEFERERQTVRKLHLSISKSSKKDRLDITVSTQTQQHVTAISLELYLIYLPIFSVRKIDNELIVVFKSISNSISDLQERFKKYNK